MTSTPTLLSQPDIGGDGPRYFGTTGEAKPYDTTAQKEARERTMESAGLLERPINPESYRVGPNDWVTVTIWTSKTQQYDILVTPDAKILIPTVGEVDIRSATLSEAEKKVERAVRKVYRVDGSLALRKMREFKVNVIGAVKSAGTVPATPTTRVSEVLDLIGGTLPRADKRNIFLYRQGDGDTRQTMMVDLMPFYAYGDLRSNPYVEGGDVIQLNIVDPENVIQISGAVNAEGEFTHRYGDSISSLIRYAYGFSVDANMDSIEVVSVGDAGGIVRKTFHRAFPDGSVENDRALEIGDRVFVRSKPRYRKRDQIRVAGEVVKPGFYPISPGETTLKTVLEAAGGFTSSASIEDASLIRRQAWKDQDSYFNYINLIDPEDRTPEEAEYFRTHFQEERKKGQMTVDFPSLMAGDFSQDIEVIDFDSLYVPTKKEYVRVSGKVKNPGNILYQPNQSYVDYITQAGGFGWKADIGETQVIKAGTGDRVPAEDEGDYVLKPGDAIFVPEEQPSDFWSGFATTVTVVAQVATIIAVIVSVIPNN